MYQDISNAGRLAIALARQVFFGDKVMRNSSLAGNLGKYDVLSEEKLAQIEDIIFKMYKPNDGGALWLKCRVALGKKCQELRIKGSC